VNNELVHTHWLIGKAIIEREQTDNMDEKTSRTLITELSKALTLEIGKGFSRSNLTYMRLLYIYYPIGVTVSHQLTWYHYYELLKIDDPLERSFYEKQSIAENWTIRELRRQKKTLLFHRFAVKTAPKRYVIARMIGVAVFFPNLKTDCRLPQKQHSR
jgi:hypothetical protein